MQERTRQALGPPVKETEPEAVGGAQKGLSVIYAWEEMAPHRVTQQAAFPTQCLHIYDFLMHGQFTTPFKLFPMFPCCFITIQFLSGFLLPKISTPWNSQFVPSLLQAKAKNPICHLLMRALLASGQFLMALQEVSITGL